MQINLAQMIRRAGTTRQKVIVVSPIEPASGLRADLLAIYMQVVRAWSQAVPEQIMPEYRRTVGDSVDDVRGDVDELEAAMSRLVLTLTANLEDWVVRVEKWHRDRFSSLFTPYGARLDMLLSRGDVQQTLEAVLAENVGLIRSLNDQMRNGISGSVFRGLTNRSTAAEVAREIRKVASIGKARAELIAADQLQKLTGRLDEERQKQVGAKKFQWHHSRKRFPRPEHVDRNGKIYRWDSVIARTDPPGRKIRCGCRARAVIEL